MTNAAAAFTVDRKTFADAVAKVVRYVPERAPVPVLRGILITADGGSVWMVATDYDDTARASAAASVERAGQVLVDGAVFARIVRNLPGDMIRIKVDGMYAVIASGPTTYKLLTMPADDYPNMDHVEPVALEKVKPVVSDGVQLALTRPEGFMKGFRKTWKASKTKTLYAPTDLAPGASVTWERRTRVSTTVDDVETMTGQVWADGPSSRTVWALVEGERSPVLVQAPKGTTPYEIVDPAKPAAWVVKQRAVTESTVFVALDDLHPGDTVLDVSRPSLWYDGATLDNLAKSDFAGGVVESVGGPRRADHAGRLPVTLADGRTMWVHPEDEVRVIRAAEIVEDAPAQVVAAV